ncbi:TonB-dependent receptor [Reichenbachiella agariperforans]|uniref:TonB-dependent receptor n=1 Tax=Reichenbachiella agariperforans TaxID=156994 RepID=UPI001C08A5E0|nr:TonB-dependent receptor [Reichenbachiella agariperforans]MBU2915428.1 TonB-dependent receptor [Reichenbachiella agariperforans]
MKKTITILVGILLALISISQAQVQTVKGSIIDAQSEYPLIGASIQLVGSSPIVGGLSDINGLFSLENVPTGRQSLQISYIGYKSITLPNILVTAGKEVMLRIKLEESVEQLSEVVISADADRDLPINELAKVSARTFSPDDVTRFSGGRNDVARLAASFAGVSAPNDSRNDIVVRGNSPTGLLWRLNGLPIATTNHFATLGTTGGPVSALNTNMLRSSDFLTGAFPAEYGNANAAVFDVNFRNGNSDQYEFTGQMSIFSGLEAMAEGPLIKKNGSSFLISYRYGLAQMAATGTSAVPIYQDLSFKLNFGTSPLGRFELFGMGGLSSIDFFGEDIDENDLFANPDEDAFVDNDLGLLGLSHTGRLGKTAYIKSTVGASTYSNQFFQDNFVRDANDDITDKYRAVNVNNRESRISLTSALNKKFNARWSLRTGFLSEMYLPNFFTESRDNQADIPDNNGDGIPDYYILARDFDDRYAVSQLFAQAMYNASDRLSITYGLHALYHSHTESKALEPRAAVSYELNSYQRISFAYGLHAQAIPSPVLFYEEETSPGVYERTNEDLGFTRSHHFVLGYNRSLGTDWRLKSELYYQYLFDVPVESLPSSYSVVNEGADFVFDNKGSLVNEGTGRNYGIELTLEKFFSQGYYLLMTTSIYNSEYKGSDGLMRNTAFNNQFVFNTLFGKEWKFGSQSQHAWTFDTKFTTAGGQRYTPIDLAATRQNNGEEVRYENQAFEDQLANYLRWDVKLGVRLNSTKRNVSHQFYIDFQNVTNRKNEFVRRYNEVTDAINVVEQTGFFPDVLYRINF